MPNINDYGLPFTSQDGDRKYSALEWREYFSRLIHNGLIQNAANECQVKPQAAPNKTVYVDTGVVFINGAMRILEAPVTLAVAENTSGNPRIDRVVARLNEASRTIEFAVLEGTPAGSPVAPALTRTAGVYELGLADITLANGYSMITATEITDQRWDVSLCGASSMTIGVIPPKGLDAVTVQLEPETANLYGLSGVDANVDKALEDICPRLNYLQFKAFVTETVDKTMIVPDNVNKVYIWACAAGINASNSLAGKAGDFIIGKEFNVTPGGTINITVGSGNTIISGAGINETLIAGNSTLSVGYTGFGIVTGIAGGAAATASVVAPGGAFGYGGGAGAVSSTQLAGVGGGINNVLPGGTPVINATGGNGVKGLNIANLSKLLPNLFTSAGAGGSGAANSSSPNKAGGNSGGGNLGGQTIANGAGGNGGGAGGYGAAGGNGVIQTASGVAGQPSPGMVLIGY